MHIGPFFSSGRGPLLALSAVGHAGRPCVLTTQVWAAVGLCGARSGRSKSRNLASNHGIAFRLAEPRRTMETPQDFFCSTADVAAAVVSCMHHTVPQALKLSILWQQRLNSSRTSSDSFCDLTRTVHHCVCVFVPCFLST